MPKGISMYSVLDLTADENRAAVRAHNFTALTLVIEEMCRTEGVTATEAKINEILERYEAGLN